MIRSLFEPKRTRVVAWLAGPIVLGMASQVIFNLVDTAMVGRLGPASQAAVGLGGYGFWVLGDLIIGIGTAVQATASRRDGEGDRAGAGATLDTGLALSVVVGLPLGFGLARSSPWFFSLLSEDPEVVALGAPYLAIRLMALGIIASNCCFRGFYNGVGRSLTYMGTIAATHVFNLFFNWVFIYGNLGSKAMGVNGAALATVLAAILGTSLYSIQTLARSEIRSTYQPLRFANLATDRARRLIRLAIPECLRLILMVGGYLLFLRLHSALGTREAAAGTILVNIASLGYLPAMGVGLAGATLVGRHLGQGDAAEARRHVWIAVRLCMALVLLPSLVLVLMPEKILGVFTTDWPVIHQSASALRLYGLVATLDCLPGILMFSLIGAGATRWVAACQFAQQYLLMLPLAWLFGGIMGLGVFGLWMGIVASRVVIGAVVIWKFRGSSWEGIDV